MIDMGVILLAGGESRRMGFPKWALPWGAGTLLTYHIEQAFLAGFQDIIVSANDRRIERYMREQQVAVPFISDTVPGRGPLSGLAKALEVGQSEWYMVVAVDMPNWNYRIMRSWLETYVNDTVEAIVPVLGEQQHPLGALYRTSLVSSMKEALDNGVQSLQTYLSSRNIARIGMHDPGRWMGNCNTLEDLCYLRRNTCDARAKKLVISVNAGRSKMGKTLVAQRLLEGLCQRGIFFGYVKSSHHNPSAFIGKGDTKRALASGAKVAGLVGPMKYALYDVKDVLERGSSGFLGYGQGERLHTMLGKVLSFDGVDGAILESRTYCAGRSIQVVPLGMKANVASVGYGLDGWLPFGACTVHQEQELYTMSVLEKDDDVEGIVDKIAAYYREME